MTHDEHVDSALQRQFDALRQQDAVGAPAYQTMMAKARTMAAGESSVGLPAPVFVAAPQARSAVRQWAWGVPLLIAAGLAVVLLRTPDRGDQEFEELVTQWSRNNSAQRSPTDRLLSTPGSEYLRSTPSIGVSSLRSPS